MTMSPQAKENGRLLVAALFVVFGIGAVVAILSEVGVFPGQTLPLGLGLAACFIVLVFGAVNLFNPWWLSLRNAKAIRARLQNEGLLIATEFQARRAVLVQEFEDEGLHYFLELADGRVLFLTGQYLYDYEPLDDADDGPQPRRFPCTEFTIERHRTEGFVVEMACRGVAFEPEFIAAPFSRQVNPFSEHFLDDIPEDGAILANLSFDAIKSNLVEAREG